MPETLYLKWRPRRFSDVVGQDNIVDVLLNQSATERFSHAYLFCGSRGTGKTTCARLLAKAVNCPHKDETGDPCGECEVCRGIESGDYLDCIEQDAASNNGVDDIRALKELAANQAASGNYRVYIIDEVHMLSASAFNAFLKLLEEPPEHCVFILATTDVQKLPATILSRCQRFDFKRIPENLIAERLLYVAEEESIDLTQEGAARLASLADGAMRNALSSLEQLAGTGRKIDAQAVSELLGLAGGEMLTRLGESIARGDSGNALQTVDELYTAGVSAENLARDMASLFRDAAVVKAGAQVPFMGAGYGKQALDTLGALAGMDRLIYFTSETNEISARLRNSGNARVDIELLVLRLCNPVGKAPQALAARLDKAEHELRALKENGIRVTATAAAPVEKSADSTAVASAEEKTVATEEVLPPPIPEEKLSSLAVSAIEYKEPFMEALKSEMSLLHYVMLQDAELMGADGYLVVLCKNKAQKDFLSDKTACKLMEEKASLTVGKPVRVILHSEEDAAGEGLPDGFGSIVRFGEENPGVVEYI